jgi:hypothetical protein
MVGITCKMQQTRYKRRVSIYRKLTFRFSATETGGGFRWSTRLKMCGMLKRRQSYYFSPSSPVRWQWRQYDYGTLLYDVPTVQRPFDVGIDRYIVMKKTSPHVRSIVYDLSTYVLYDKTILVQYTYSLRGQDL